MTIRVLITGAAGQIGYALVRCICEGYAFGKDQPIIVHLFDIPPMMKSLEGLVMELHDCAFPLLKEAIATTDEKVAFKEIDAAFMVGAMPRKQGMERKDLLSANVKIFKSQGAALDQFAKKTVKVLVVGNPANTNCLIMSKYAPSIAKENFSAMTRLDMNRGIAQLAMKANVACNKVTGCIIWGNHSNTQFVDASHATIENHEGKKLAALQVINDDNWIKTDFLKCVQQRGATVIQMRGLSSALSAAKAAADHMKDWFLGTTQIVSMGVISDGNHYDIPEGIVCSVPVTICDGKWKIVEGLSFTEDAKKLLQTSIKELLDERQLALDTCV